MAKIALQLYTVKDDAARDLYGTLRAVGRMGYDGVEFAGVPQEDAAEVKSVLDEARLETAGVVVPMHDLRDDAAFTRAVAYCHILGTDTIVLPWLTEEYRGSAAAYRATAHLLNTLGRRALDQGLNLLYHVHGYEFAGYGGVNGLQILVEFTDPSLVGLEPDTYWIEHGGADAVDVYRRYAQRSPSIHFKDMRDRAHFHDVEVGSGVIDIASILRIAKGSPVRWFIVEQEQFDIPAMESAAVSYRNLKSLVEEHYVQ